MKEILVALKVVVLDVIHLVKTVVVETYLGVKALVKLLTHKKDTTEVK